MLVRPVAAETLTLPLPAGRETHFAFESGLLELALQYAPGDHSLEVISLEGLSQKRMFNMLENGRFDVMHLALHELRTQSVMNLLSQHGLMVYQNLLVRYPYDFYFYVRRDSKPLHDLIEQGFQAATENGVIDKYFQAHPGIAYATRFLQDHPDLRIIDLGNPEMTENNSADIHRYWLEH
ncbi:hypothetical protein [Thalassospira tepidiphila]|uniref:hypothetical protein n=1 Tax=Thalassospira tepidiphila TaxID=393657 RepID=UPI003AA9572B